MYWMKYCLYIFSEKIQKICDSFPPSNVNSVHGTSSDLNRVVPSLTIFESVAESQVLKIIMNAPKTCCSRDPIPTNLLIDNLDFFLPHITHLVIFHCLQVYFLNCLKQLMLNHCWRSLHLTQMYLKTTGLYQTCLTFLKS